MKSKKVLNEKNVILFLFPAVPPEIFVQRRSRYFSQLSDFWGLFYFFNCCVTWLLLIGLHLSCFCTLPEWGPPASIEETAKLSNASPHVGN